VHNLLLYQSAALVFYSFVLIFLCWWICFACLALQNFMFCWPCISV